MKRMLILLLLAGIGWGCNTPDRAQVKSETIQEESHQHEASATALQLNNGAKWKSDSATNLQVEVMKNRIQSFDEKKEINLVAYHQLGENLKAEVDKLIKECRMEGPDHDALHIWLQPLIEKTHQLQTTTDGTAAAELKTQLAELLHVYSQYFE